MFLDDLNAACGREFIFVCYVCFASFQNFINGDFVYFHVVSFLHNYLFFNFHNKNTAVEIHSG